MDVRDLLRAIWPFLLVFGFHLSNGAGVHADPMYTVIDLGTGPLTYGADTNGDGTVTGSNGLTYIFNSLQYNSSAPSSNTTQVVPIPVAAPTGVGDTNGDPNYAYSYVTNFAVNSQGLGVGYDVFGVDGHLSNTQVFATQLQANGAWGQPIYLWSGEASFGVSSAGVGILGVSPNGQILGYGYNMGQIPSYDAMPSGFGLYLYDTKSQSFTNLTNLIDSTVSPANTNWFLNMPFGQIDNQGRILLTQEVYEGDGGPLHSLLLVPDGVSADPVVAPEPATWAIFASLIGGWMVRKCLRAGTRAN
jgi:hypothetical protein